MWSDNEDDFTNEIKNTKRTHKILNKLDTLLRDTTSRFRATFHSTLLPAGFPDSVHHCYVPFSFWQSLETTAGSIIQVLCSQAMLSSVGLPTDVGTVTGGAVAIRWVIKDGLSHFAQLLFTKIYAYGFDFRPKSWGIISETFILCGSIFELTTIVAATYGYPWLFIPLAAIGASLQAVGHSAWSATHATFIRGLSLRNNIADVTAKSHSQMVVSELIGLSLGIVFIQLYYEPLYLFICFLLCAPINIIFTLCR